ncbi:GNAT family N-acetyltransferase [Phytomonospora sp. NPDC050363]|uniref:GNAT family N-acetyltransferase n=1 Tax=Phytomonospora sp. NPDC050363 TaxID=3155642 RepID=UPI0033D1C81E
MSTLNLTDVTADSPTADLDAWMAVRTAAHAVDAVNLPALWRESEIGGLGHPWPGSHATHFLVRRDGEAVAVAEMSLPQDANTNSGWVSVTVTPRLRRQGIGREALDLLYTRFKAEGRTRAMTEGVASLPGGVARDESGEAFIAASGYRRVGDEVRRQLDLSTVDLDAETRFFEQAAAKAGEDYELVRFIEPVPEKYLADLAAMNARLSEDTAGYIEDWEPAAYDSAKILGYQEAAAARLHRRPHVAALHKPSGRLVAWAFLALVSPDGRHAEHCVTVVMTEHRGHRLGMLVKTGLHRYARQIEPRLRWIDTWNAAENTHMIAVNDELGFVPVESYVEYVREL